MFTVGDMVETAVFVGTDRIPMGSGRVVEVRDGYCMVDHCYPYGKPWIYAETNTSLAPLNAEKPAEPAGGGK